MNLAVVPRQLDPPRAEFHVGGPAVGRG